MPKNDRLKEIREALGWTQVQMGEALELDPTYVSSLENGRFEIQPYVWKKAEALLANFEKSKSLEVKEGVEKYGAPGADWRERALSAEMKLKLVRAGLSDLLKVAGEKAPVGEVATAEDEQVRAVMLKKAAEPTPAEGRARQTPDVTED
jgi:transcriptional regulator with XRE-family HTH domain